MMENERVEDLLVADPDADIRQLAVLQNDVVLRTIFKFLDFQTLMICRLVNWKWKSVCEPRFRQRAKVNCIKAKRYDNMSCDVSILQRLFSQEECEIPITTLVLGGTKWWDASELQEFFTKEGMSITDLTLENLTVFDDGNGKYESFDAFLFFMPSLNRLKISHGVKDRPWPPLSTSFTVPLDVLGSLEYLYICNCQIVSSDGCFSPVELVLEGRNEYFFKGEKMQKEVLSLNDFVNFRRLENLIIRDVHCNISVNFEGCVALKNLELSRNIQLLNWEWSKWSIESLRLEEKDFLRREQITGKMKTLHICRSKIDLSVLPSTIETLVLESCEEIKLLDRMYVPNLKRLRSINNTSFDFLVHFKNCDTITELRLELTNHYLPLNVENIPKGVKKLVLNKNMTRYIGSRNILLDTLALVGCHFDNWQFSQLPVKHIFCLKRYGFTFSDDVIRSIIEVSNTNCETISAGAFIWPPEKQFSDSFISNYVDKQAEYYTFKAGRGEAVPEKLVWEKCWSWTD